MSDPLVFKDPHKGQKLTVLTVPKGQLQVIKHQRKPRPAHIKGLTASIERIGFVTPLVVVEEGDGSYLIIDGQHRFTAASELGIKRFPVVVVPPALAKKMTSFNVEKDLNIRERSVIVLSMYREFVEEHPTRKENHAEVVDTLETVHHVTLGLAYEGPGTLAGSSFEPILRKCDTFEDMPLQAATEMRQQRAEQVLEANKLIKAITDEIKKRGAYHSYISAQIISAANPLKRARKPSKFDTAFKKFITKLTELAEDPGPVLRTKPE